jgi:hypothetical protein
MEFAKWNPAIKVEASQRLLSGPVLVSQISPSALMGLRPAFLSLHAKAL